MQDTIIDQNLSDTPSNLSIKTTLFLGMTLYLAVSGLGFFIETVLRDVFVLINLSPWLNFFLNKAIALFLVFWMAYFIANYAKESLLQNRTSAKSLLRDFILLFVLSQVLQFVFDQFSAHFFTQNYFTNLSNYHEGLGSADIYQYIAFVNYFAKYIAIAWGISRI